MEYTSLGQKGFKAGNPGKPKGAVSAKTKAWEELGEYICERGAERYMNALTALEDEKFLEKYAYILEFFKPKLARQEQSGPGGKELPQPIINVFQNNSNPKDSQPQQED